MVDVVEDTLAPVIDVVGVDDVGHPIARVVDVVIVVIEYTPDISFSNKENTFYSRGVFRCSIGGGDLNTL